MTSGDIVWVRFPRVERDGVMRRPAMLLSQGLVGSPRAPLFCALMITNARRPDWPGDVLIPDHAEVGLNIACKVRTAKVETVEVRFAERVGRLPEQTLADVLTHERAILASSEAL